MLTIIASAPLSRFATAEAARSVAAANAAADPDWTYTVEQHGERFVVVVRDEDGLKVGCI